MNITLKSLNIAFLLLLSFNVQAACTTTSGSSAGTTEYSIISGSSAVNSSAITDTGCNGVVEIYNVTGFSYSNTSTITRSSAATTPDPRALLFNVSSIDTFQNAGTITSATTHGVLVYGATVNNFINSGSIQAANSGSYYLGVFVNGSGSIGTLTNSSNALISGGVGVQSNGGIVNNIVNDGTITGTIGAGISLNFARAIVDTITNNGVITGNTYDILNSATSSIVTLNNIQGNGNALTYSGRLPTNYNVIISTPSVYGQLAVTSPSGSTSFGISSLSASSLGLAGTRYTNVITGLTASSISNELLTQTYTTSGYTATYQLVQGSSATAWDLLLLSAENIVRVDDTLASLRLSANALRGAYSLQSAIINTGLSYDCTTFDKNGICVSAGGRVTDTNNPSTNSQGALLIASYRANEQWRVGAYLDQNLSSNDARGVNLDNNSPMGGVFAVWNQNTDATGYQVRLASGYSDKNLTVSRSVVGTAEAGKGNSSLQSQAYSATLSRGIQINDSRWIASPYLGVRYTKIKRAGYTEDNSADVTAPLTYSALSQETTTALVGVRFNGQLGDKINLMASTGIENDIAHKTGDYAATGVDGLTPIAFNQNIRHIRPVASAGASYAIDKRQTVGANLNFRQEAFNSTNSVSGMVTYQVGF